MGVPACGRNGVQAYVRLSAGRHSKYRREAPERIGLETKSLLALRAPATRARRSTTVRRPRGAYVQKKAHFRQDPGSDSYHFA